MIPEAALYTGSCNSAVGPEELCTKAQEHGVVLEVQHCWVHLQDAKLSGPVDILVASPTKVLQHVKDGNLFYRDVRWLVGAGLMHRRTIRCICQSSESKYGQLVYRCS